MVGSEEGPYTMIILNDDEGCLGVELKRDGL